MSWDALKSILMTDDPAGCFGLMRVTGTLQQKYPEIYALIGREQNQTFHGEGDVFNHTMMVLRCVSRNTKDIDLRFAALIHDVGKGVFTENYYNHHALGVNVIERMNYRLNIPEECLQLAMLVAEYHLKHYTVFDMRPMKIRSVLTRLDAYKQPHRFLRFLDVCKADYQGRILNDRSCEYDEYLQGQYLVECRSAIMLVQPTGNINKTMQIKVALIKQIREKYREIQDKQNRQ